MKTAHEFAKELLAGPDLPICVPQVREYQEEGFCMDPIVSAHVGEDADENPCTVLLISYAADAS